MPDKRREPVERNPRPIQTIPKPNPESMRPSNRKRRSRTKRGHSSSRKRSRVRKPHPDLSPTRSSFSSGLSRADSITTDQESNTEDVTVEDSDSRYSSVDEAIIDVGVTEDDYLTKMSSDGVNDSDVTVIPRNPEVDSITEGVKLARERVSHTLVSAAVEDLRPVSRANLRRQPTHDDLTTLDVGTLPKPVTYRARARSGDIIRTNANFIRLNFALMSVLVHISTQNPPSSTQLGTLMKRLHAIVNSGTLVFPLLLFILFEPSSSNVSKWARNSGFYLNSFWIRMWTLIFIVIIKILVVVEVFQHLPLWIGIFLLAIAIMSFVPFLVIVLVMNLLHESHKPQLNETSIRVVLNVVYGSLILVHMLEMRPSLLRALINAAAPDGVPTSPVLNIASLCFNLAVILQLPALFLDASCIGFCNCVVGKRGNSAGVASLLLTVLFQTSLSSFLSAIGVTMVANGVSTLGFCLYVGIALIFMVLVGCYQLDILPVGTVATGKQRVE